MLKCKFYVAQMPDVIKDVQNAISGLAVYVDLARQDESRHVTDPLKSLASDIEHLQETGIYDLLCSLQMASLRHGVDWKPVGDDEVVLVGCRTFGHQAPIDNRNFMTLYALNHLLQRIDPSVVTSSPSSSSPSSGQQHPVPPPPPLVLSTSISKRRRDDRRAPDASVAPDAVGYRSLKRPPPLLLTSNE